MEIGLYSFGELTPDAATGRAQGAGQRLKEIVAAAVLADQAGLDVFGLGEHHRLDFSISATPVVLAAIAQATRKIRLTSAVTILSTADPVRVFEDFATLDLLSDGRAELIAGRGVFTESFPLFGFDLADNDRIFAEKLELLLQLAAGERVTWKGRVRPPLDDAAIAPRPEGAIPIWIGTGGTPESIQRAAAWGLPISLANISAPPARFAPLVEAYRAAGVAAGHPASALKVAVASHLHIARDSQQALDAFYPHYARYFANHTPSQYQAHAITRDDYERLAGPEGPLLVGSPAQIVDKLVSRHSLLRPDRFLAQIDIGGLPYRKVADTIELLAMDVAPALRRELG
jgi:probable LLM family oxidoreductase